MKIVFLGDSITDMDRNRNVDNVASSYGFGYPFFIAGKLLKEDASKYIILNRGVSGDRIVDMYARIKKDLWNLEPDVASFLFGINDLWHEIMFQNGVDIKRFENIYRLIIKETKERLPNTKLILMEPFVLKAIATSEKYDEFLKIKEYANIVKTLAKEFNLPIVLLQDQFEEATKNQPVNLYLTDGIHPNCEGAKLICDEWLKIFNLEIK